MLALRLMLGGVFVYAGLVKMRFPQAFADGVAAYRILPGDWVNGFALTLPPFEVMLGVWLIIGWRLRSAAFCAAVTLLVFLSAIASAHVRGLKVDCACFGAADPRNPTNYGLLALARDGVLTAAALVLYATAWRETRARYSGL
jgi:putative oxidoreductase